MTDQSTASSGVQSLWKSDWFYCRALFFVLVLCCAESLLLNIHLPLQATPTFNEWCPYNNALQANLVLRQNAHGLEQIDFFKQHTPHMTLYLAEFDVEDMNGTVDEDKLQVVLDAVQHALSNSSAEEFPPCRVDWQELPVIQGPYAMYPIPLTTCLQKLSDGVVNATMENIRRPPPIPDWVHSLPEPERRQMIERIGKYGSPNVFDGFEPHVTVGFDATTSKKDRMSVLRSLSLPQPCFGSIAAVAVARTGVGGTVLQDGKLLEVPLYQEEEAGADPILVSNE